jgi:hypothetical protein
LGVGLHPYPVKKKIVEKPPRNSAGFCGGGQGLSWAVEPRGERERSDIKLGIALFEEYVSLTTCIQAFRIRRKLFWAKG